MIAPGPLTIRQTREGGVHCLTAFGEFDLATAPLLESALDAVLGDAGAERMAR